METKGIIGIVHASQGRKFVPLYEQSLEVAQEQGLTGFAFIM